MFPSVSFDRFATSRSLPILVLAALAPLWLAPTGAEAAWPQDPYGGNVPLSQAAGDQVNETSVSDGAGGVIVVWQDKRNGSNYDIYAQRVNATGVPQWTVDGVPVCSAAADQYLPVIAADGAGGAIISWYDSRGGSTADIYVQRVNAAGAMQWTANGVLLTAVAGDQSYPAIVSDGAGGAIVAWHDGRSFANFDVYAQRVNAAGAPQWAPNGVVVSTAAGDQLYPTVVSDGAGGAIVSWEDHRNADADIYAQRINAAGVAQWAANGVIVILTSGSQDAPVSVSDGAGGAFVAWTDARSGTSWDIYANRVTATGVLAAPGSVAVVFGAGDQQHPAITSDGAGGAIVTWDDGRSGGGSGNDIYAQRLSANCTPEWAANGVAVCTAGTDQLHPAIASDGANGAIVGWLDNRYSSSHVFAQRVTAAGNPAWTSNGVAICAASGSQSLITATADGTGGAIFTWANQWGAPYDLACQRVERFGHLGNPEPSIVKVRDVQKDQGGKVTIQWNASSLDVVPGGSVDTYWIWRQIPAASMASPAAKAEPFVALDARTGEPTLGAVQQTVVGSQVYYWEYVGSQAANGFAGYSYLAPTAADSVAAANAYTLFMVEARQTSSGYYWDSAPDSGYSVDNLPPAAPASFAGQYNVSSTALHWSPNGEADFASYALYAGTSADFVPSPSNLVVSQPDTGYVHATSQAYYYKLAAIDVHGNVSVFSLVSPGGVTAVEGSTLPAWPRIAGVAPNPAPREAAIRFALPREEPATLVVFDPAGRRVRQLASGTMTAGEHLARWDGRDDAGGHAPSGLYFVRLVAAGRIATARLALLR